MADNSKGHETFENSVNNDKPYQLTDEEKAVLLECRRNSIARGVPIGVMSVIGLRYFVQQGRVPANVQKWSIFYYVGTFLITSLLGVSSYKQKCMDKIMQLENSYIADQLRQYHARQGKGGSGSWLPQECTDEEKGKKRGKRRGEESYKSPHTPIPSSSGGDDTGSNDMWVNASSKDTSSSVSDGNKDSNVKKGRTFDEIREQNRAKQIQQNFPSSQQPKRQPTTDDTQMGGAKEPQGTGVPRPIRRNKYGDIVYED